MKREIIPVGRIAQSIYILRGQQVMLDRDLAALYGVETRILNQAVKRNADRFPEDFAFTLTRVEIGRISQIVTSSSALRFSKQVRVFTEQGVAMLSGVRLRKTLETNRALAGKFEELEERVGGHDKQIVAIIDAIRQLMAPPEKPRREIGFHVRETAPRYGTRKRRTPSKR